MDHLTVEVADGAHLHVARTGEGPPLLLLHGWPEFWWTWEPVMIRLADRFTLIAPDLRGFGDSAKPAGRFGPADHAADLRALLDALGFGQVGFGQVGFGKVGMVGHDIGGAIMQAFAREMPERCEGLFFFDFVYPGIGARMATPDRLSEIWYQSFHQLDLAVALVGASRETCRAYLGHIIRHWAHRADAFDDAVLDVFVDTYMKPGNLEGGFAHYKAANAARLAMIAGTAPPLPPIAVPTCVRWAAHDPLFPATWTDRLGETFTDLDVAIMPDVGHFPHREDPDAAAREIAGFFTRV